MKLPRPLPKGRVILELTFNQSHELTPLFQKMGPDDTIIAQVFHDGIRCRLLNKEQGDAVRKALDTTNDKRSISAFDWTTT